MTRCREGDPAAAVRPAPAQGANAAWELGWRPGIPRNRICVATALEAHTLGLAAELAGTGVTVNIVRPGPADTAMPAWILAQPPAQIGAGLHERFVAMRDAGLLASPDQPARMIADLVTGDTTGQIAGADTPATISA